jgi:hypothetical protein
MGLTKDTIGTVAVAVSSDLGSFSPEGVGAA